MVRCHRPPHKASRHSRPSCRDHKREPGVLYSPIQSLSSSPPHFPRTRGKRKRRFILPPLCRSPKSFRFPCSSAPHNHSKKRVELHTPEKRGQVDRGKGREIKKKNNSPSPRAPSQEPKYNSGENAMKPDQDNAPNEKFCRFIILPRSGCYFLPRNIQFPPTQPCFPPPLPPFLLFFPSYDPNGSGVHGSAPIPAFS